jgi:ABC-type glycerol-3-phosphate transport system permease component
MNTHKFQQATFKFIIYLLLACGLIFTAAPFVWMFSSSFKFNAEIFSYPLTFVPRKSTLSNYIRLINGSEIPFLRQFLNSLIIALSHTAMALFVSSIVGFGFAKYEFRLKRPLFVIMLATIMVPFQVTIVPLFMLMNTFRWLDTYWAVIIPGAFSAFGVFFMRQIMVGIPGELLDAARIDGASDFTIYWRIALPLSSAGLAILAVLFFLGAWNDYLWPVIALRTARNFTLPVGLATLLGLYKIEYGMLMAGAFLATLPIILLFVAGRNQFIEGLTAGAFKG